LSSVVRAKFTVGRSLLSACGQTDDLEWGDTIIWYMLMTYAVHRRQPGSDIWLEHLPLIWPRWGGYRVASLLRCVSPSRRLTKKNH